MVTQLIKAISQIRSKVAIAIQETGEASSEILYTILHACVQERY